ncbi:MAG: metallopeptidase family protein [Deltaproteobacteria bacterium]|nr:metallopeptidase family protein [Deltaproteobacteria bacterium]
MKLSRKNFDKAVDQAVRRIPPAIRRHLENVAITVEQHPSRELLEEIGAPPGETLLGIYLGTALVDRSITAPPVLPDSIVIFQAPLEEICETLEELEEEIEITVVHEIAHFIGIGEDRLRELGYE